MPDASTLVLYDISSPLRPRSFAPNPSKARYALAFKNVPFTTTWVDILDIPAVRKGLDCPATRKLDDGSDYYTLPMVRDPRVGKVVGDSFDIAIYLDDHFPDSGAGRLFPLDSTRTGLDYLSPFKDTAYYAPITTNMGSRHADYASFNFHVDATFTFSGNVGLCMPFLPFNPETAESAKAMMAKRAHLNSWDDTRTEGEAREMKKESARASLETLAHYFTVHEDGPFLEGKHANYADIIVGGWLNMMYSCLPPGEWREVKSWHGGVFGLLHDALQEQVFFRS
ncbi:hypothetical protein BJ742DRAFT_817797 [Cladochytrium replicatum]|nr:hypothetical protein BJ742DRAFT_817797 [Cladochytrium replicatum]